MIVYDHAGVTVYHGHCLDVLAELPDESVHCCVTSPPYWALRDYGLDPVEWPDRSLCCLGLEETPELYVEHMVDVFRQVRRVLRTDGTLWLNLGDTYAGSWGAQSRHDGENHFGLHQTQIDSHPKRTNTGSLRRVPGLKAKDLIGIPWRVAFALQADGWYLRSDIIWHKPNPMPESVTDRPTKSHEYIFLMAKSERYYFDGDAISEVVTDSTIDRLTQPTLATQVGSSRVPGKTNGTMKAVGSAHMVDTPRKDGERWRLVDAGVAARGRRNKRTVWTVATQPYSKAHFATFPPKLIEPCILAGCPEGGVVLDPFLGSGTTAQVAKNLGRKCIGIEANGKYIKFTKERVQQDVLF